MDDTFGGTPDTPDLGANPLNLIQPVENLVQPVVNAVENTAAARIGEIQMIPITGSSDIAAYGYDPVEFKLQVQFTNNRIYVYSNVSPSDFAALSQSVSKGKAVWDLRRNPVTYPFVRLA